MGLTPSFKSSVIWGTARNLGSSTDAKAKSNQSILHQYDVSSPKATYWSQRTTTSPEVGKVATLSNSAPSKGTWRYAAVQVLSSNA